LSDSAFRVPCFAQYSNRSSIFVSSAWHAK
jgi:hypothetical protein